MFVKYKIKYILIVKENNVCDYNESDFYIYDLNVYNNVFIIIVM